jgi:hypothetical protein
MKQETKHLLQGLGLIALVLLFAGALGFVASVASKYSESEHKAIAEAVATQTSGMSDAPSVTQMSKAASIICDLIEGKQVSKPEFDMVFPADNLTAQVWTIRRAANELGFTEGEIQEVIRNDNLSVAYKGERVKLLAKLRSTVKLVQP